MVLAHRERIGPKPTQRVLAAGRIASGRPTPLPGPGTYARHNGVHMPALLPDGSQSELSVSPVLSGIAAPADQPAGGRPVAGGEQPGAVPEAALPAGQEAGDQ
jgi:NADH-quinone oxidoreductase subunit J